MKKIFTVLMFAAALLSINSSYAQVSLTVNGGFQLPAGDMSNLVKNGYGFSASLGFSIPLVPLELSVTAGYDNWPYKSQNILPNSSIQTSLNGINLYAVPVTVGPKLFIPLPLIGFKPYVGIDAGIIYSSSTASGASSKTDFIYSPIIGLRYDLPLGIVGIDINVREFNYSESGSKNSWYGINGGVAISL
jgi:hypothetical protein